MKSKQNLKYDRQYASDNLNNNKCSIKATKNEQVYFAVSDDDPNDSVNLEYYIVKNFDGTVSFRDKKGKKDIIIDTNDYLTTTEREDGAKFHPINNSDYTFSFKLSDKKQSKYISVSDNDSRLIVKAVENNIGANEMFFLYSGIFFN